MVKAIKKSNLHLRINIATYFYEANTFKSV